MTLNEYQEFSRITDKENDFNMYAFGLLEEAGEIAGKFKRLYRDHNGTMNLDIMNQIVLELGDMKWYASRIADALGVTDEQVAKANITKLTSRQERGVIHGSGDSR